MKDWQKIEEIFAAALELAPAERDVFLDEACAGNEALRQEVTSLLASHDDVSAAFLEEPLSAASGFNLPAPPTSGESVGHYRLLDKLGEGGMGTVYLGERADGAFDRQVAVKVLRRGMEDDAAMQRFDRERRILASLDHPGIARLLDGGATAAGSPYVVMELVDGEPIDDYCDGRALSVNGRIDLFLEVCDAVAAAHRSLVVHRDIKPSNVLVDQQDHVKLLDFGIAKILDPEHPGSGETTANWQRVLTPSYASPEQVRGEQITVATDVYLLGILLYKLLAGRLPHRFAKNSLAEVELVLTSDQPRRPSQVLQTASRAAADSDLPPNGVDRIDPDLDHIVLMALRSDPMERYGSVVELGDDLRRFRRGLPIRARAGSRRYRFKKFVQRHGRSLTLAGLALLFLVLFAADRALQVERRELALRRAEAALARSEGLWGFVEDLFWNADPHAAKGRELTVVEALSRGEQKLSRDAAGPADVEASIRTLFGRIYLDLGQFESANANLTEALDFFAAVDDTEPSLRVAQWRARGDLALVRFHQIDSLEEEGAEEKLASVIEEARLVHSESRRLAAVDPALALELSEPLAEIYCWLERWPEAAVLTEETMVLVRKLGAARTFVMAEAMGRRALILKNFEDDLEGAQALYSEALAIYLEREGPVHPEVANAHNQQGLIADALGDFELAITSHQAALEVRRQLYSGGHPEISKSLERLGNLFHRQGDLRLAADYHDAAVQSHREIYGPTSSRTVQKTLRLCEILIEDERAADAEALLRVELDATHRAARPDGSRLIVQAEGLLGAALHAQGKADGEALLRRSLETLRGHPEGYESVILWFESYLEEFVYEL